LGVTCALDLFLVPRYGVVGAAVGAGVGYCAAAALMTILYLRVARQDQAVTQPDAVGIGSGEDVHGPRAGEAK
jgi:Na+-driven multidrug efflux pump